MSPSDEITYISQNLEKILKSQYGAVGKGLGEMVRSVESQLPEETVQKIRTLARWRNKVMHDDMSFANKKIEAFRQIAWEVCFSLMNSQRGMGSQTVTTFRNWTSRQENTGNPSQIGGTVWPQEGLLVRETQVIHHQFHLRLQIQMMMFLVAYLLSF